MLKKQYLAGKPTCKVTFTLPLEAAPNAKEVKLLGEFNDWNQKEGILMKRSKNEYAATLELATGNRYEFRYLIDNETWENDWHADDYAATKYGIFNSVVEVSEPLDTPSLPEELMEKAQAAASKPPKKTTNPAQKKPTIAATPANTKKASQRTDHVQDDLTKIEGIGPKIAEILTQKSIVTFADLAKAKAKDLKTMLESAGSRYQMHDPSTWAEQAKLAAKGDWEKLTKLQKDLKGGKR